MNEKQNKNEDDTFYQELDQHRAHNSCCSCSTLAILFVALTILLCFTVGWGWWKITREIQFPNFSSKITNLNELKNKIANSAKSNSDQIQIPLSESELNYLIGGGFSFGNFLFRNPQAKINSDKITIYAELVKPLNAKIKFTSIPVANKGKVEFPVNEFDAGNMKLPGFVLDKFSPMLSGFISGKLEIFYSKIYVDEVKLEEGKMLIIGKGK